MDDEGSIEEHATPSPSPPQEDLRTATEKVNISTADTHATEKFGTGNDVYMTWDSPIQRYRDLGSPRRPVRIVAKENQTKINIFGAPTPINTLDGNGSNRAPLSTSRMVQEVTDSPPLKRQRLEKNNDQIADKDEERYPMPYLNSGFALREDTLRGEELQEKDTRAEFSPNAIQPFVAEYENVQNLIHPPSPELKEHIRKRRKPKSSEVIDLASDEEPVDLVQTSNMVEPDELASRFRGKPTSKGLSWGEGVRSKTLAPSYMTGKRPRSSSVDELAGDSPITKIRPVKRNAGSSSRELGHIDPIRFGKSANQTPRKPLGKNKTMEAVKHARQIITSLGLKVTQAVSGFHVYPSPPSVGEMYLPCVLRVHETSHMLHPTDTVGDIMHQVAYLTVNLAKVKQIRYPKGSSHSIISILRAVEPAQSAAARLHIEFGSPRDVQYFLKWVDMPRSDSVSVTKTEVDGERLQREMENLMTKAHLGHVIRDVDVERPKLPDDLRLVKYNQEKRRQLQQKSTTLQTLDDDSPRVKPRIKDEMHPPNSPTVRQTRAKRKPASPSPPPPPLDLWTEKNPSWAEKWRDSLIFPPTGKSRATVDMVDIPRLDEGQYLNDNLIIFYLRYLQHNLEMQRPDLAERIYFHNTFFYEKLKPTKTSAGINYDSVKAWTTRVDLFKKDFVVVPINEFSHWYIAIIYNAPKLDTTAHTLPATDSSVSHTNTQASDSSNVAGEQSTEHMAKPLVNTDGGVADGISHMSLDPIGPETIPVGDDPSHVPTNTNTLVGSDGQSGESLSVSSAERRKPVKKANTGGKKHNPDEPKIITLDSLGSGHSPACRNLKEYLVKELKDKKGAEMPDPGSLTMTAKGIPIQSNYCDCGVYLLGYVVEFLRDPDSFVRTLLLHEKIDWSIDAPVLRNEIRTLLFRLQDEQVARENERVKAKKEAARMKRKKQSRPSSSERITETPALVQMTPTPADPASMSPVISDIERSAAKEPSPVVLAQESVEVPEVASTTTTPKEADVTLLDEPKPTTPDRPVASPTVSDRSSSATTELEIETPRAMPSSSVVKGGSPHEAAQQLAQDEITESEFERNMLPPLPETPARGPAENSSAMEKNLEPVEDPRRDSTNVEVLIQTREQFEKQNRKEMKRSTDGSSKETPHKSPYFGHERIGGLQKGERVVSAKSMPKKGSPEIVNVEDSE
ncbi:SUMO protease ULP2 [Apiospora saccharicola]|uniref:SUMO protease ULP2 n=1 Tax=Apiospora saccharicola TaxID=335842 RepID=A0ABR1TJF6_9PEZI